MRKLERVRTAVAIDAKFRGQKRKDYEEDVLTLYRNWKRGDSDKLKFKSKWGPTKDQLFAETHDKCAYCEAPTRLVAHGDVEHYRPKSIYWWMAYNYDNYLSSCQICNQTFKSNHFPIKGRKIRSLFTPRASTTDERIKSKAGQLGPDPLNETEGMPWGQVKAAHEQERPLLLNPYMDDPATYFIYGLREGFEEIEVRANPKTTDSQEFVNAAKKYFGINRREIARDRYEIYLVYLDRRLIAEGSQDSEATRNRAKSRLIRMRLPQSDYSGMITYFDTLPLQSLPDV